jgi:hypothetical protein
MREEKGEEGKEESKKKGEEAMEESEKRKHEEEEDKKLDLRNGQGATGPGPGEHSSDGQGGLGIGKSMTPEVPDPFAGSMVGTVAGMSKQDANDADPADGIEKMEKRMKDFKPTIPSPIASPNSIGFGAAPAAAGPAPDSAVQPPPAVESNNEGKTDAQKEVSEYETHQRMERAWPCHDISSRYGRHRARSRASGPAQNDHAVQSPTSANTG